MLLYKWGFIKDMQVVIVLLLIVGNPYWLPLSKMNCNTIAELLLVKSSRL